MVVTPPGLAEALMRDWRKAARFCARFGITERFFRVGVPSDIDEGEAPTRGRERPPSELLRQSL
jgi:hypothetical protein